MVSKKTVLILVPVIMIIIAAVFAAGGFKPREIEKEAVFDINKLPENIRAIKYSPFLEIPAKSIMLQMKEWKENGINTVYVLIMHADGQLLYPSKKFSERYNSPAFGQDLLKEIVAAARENGLCLVAGNWMFRDHNYYPSHREQWQVNSEGRAALDQYYLCPNSSYMDDVVYPIYEEIVQEYGIKNVFLQEMWFCWDGKRPVMNCYCDNCLKKFGELSDKLYIRDELANSVLTDKELAMKWDNFHMDTLVGICDRFKSIVGPGGTVMWHNPGEANWFLAREYRNKLEDVWLSNMELFPDDALFRQRDPNEMDPWLVYHDRYEFHKLFGNRNTFLEYYSLYGMQGLTRPITHDDIVWIYLAAKAAGTKNLLIEAYPFIDWAERRQAGVWDAIKETFTEMDPIFENAAFIGPVEGAVDWLEGTGYHGVWEAAGGEKILVLGTTIEGEGCKYKILLLDDVVNVNGASYSMRHGRNNIVDIKGNTQPEEGVLKPGEVMLLIVK